MVQVFPGNAGGAQLSVIEPIDGRLFTGASAPAASTAYLSLFRVAVVVTVSAITIQHGTPSGNGDVGIYQLVGSTYTLIASAGSTALTGSNATQTLTLSAAVTLIPGRDYWMAFAADNATTTEYRLLGLSGTGLTGKKALSKGSTFPLASFSSPGGTGYVPWLSAA